MDFSSTFISYLTEAAGENNTHAALDALSGKASVSVRLNPAKLKPADNDMAGRIFSMKTSQVPWSPYGFFLESRPQFTLDPLMHAGCYYVQDSSAMFVGTVFRQALRSMQTVHRPLRVLDLCAAPGGKTTDILASLRMSGLESYILVSNEVMKQRAAILSDNAGIWGDPLAVVTSADPKAFARLEGFFDIIVADVPCSGEGMFRKDDEAVAQWSADNVALCQARQRRIVADVWPALAEGGIFIYSTCTFNRYENDLNAEWIASELGAKPFSFNADFPGILRTDMGASLIPGLVPGEGQYCSALIKSGGQVNAESTYQKTERQHGRQLAAPALAKDISARIRDLFTEPVALESKGSMIIAVPESIEEELIRLDYLRPLHSGTAVGEVKGKDIVPNADLALSQMLRRGAFPEAEISRNQALAFLHKDTITLPDAARGILLLTYEGHPIGFVKNLGNRCNNLHPQDRRIRMNI